MKNTIHNTQYAILITLILTWLILPPTAQAATYYLDAVNGDDANPGTSEAPWQTLARAYTWYSGSGPKVQEGDIVLFRNGNYGQFKESTGTNPGENWLFYRNNWITYKADTGHSPVLSDVYIRNEDKWGTIEHGRSHIILDGFRVEEGVYVSHTSYIQVKNCTVSETTLDYGGYNTPYYPAESRGIYFNVTHYGTIEDCNVYDAQNTIYIGAYSSDINISGNECHRIGEDGIKFADHVNNIVIENNYIHDWRKRSSGMAIHGTINGTFEVGETVIQAGTNAAGRVSVAYSTRIGVYETTEAQFDDEEDGGGTVTGQNSGATLSNVTLIDPAHTDGISFQGTDVNAIVIRGNKIIGTTAQGVKVENNVAGSMDDVLFENNLIYSLGQSLSITGVTNIRMINNTFMDEPSNGIQGARFSCGKGDTTIIEMYNNIFDKFFQFTDSGSYTNRVVSHGNNIFGEVTAGGPAYPFALDSSEAVTSNLNALFTNAAGNDYTLKAGSAAIDFGNPDYGPDIDILGNPRNDAAPDAGCYEYGTTSIIYGDVNADGEISAYDAALTAQAAVGLITLTPEQITAADVNGDSEISAYDAALIAQKAVGLIEKFPI